MGKKELSKTYDPSQVEDKWYRHWEEEGFFAPDPDSEAEPFTIVMPPPNVTGSLHMGHALDNTLQDILIRFRRMQGRNTLWVPGTDHAGIATQAKVEAEIAKEGKSKHDIGREAFLEKTWEWKHLYGGRITTQLRKLGSSCDWSRERFTMDEGCSEAVKEAFVNLYEKGLIYQDNYIINWCPSCQTTISDIEVEHSEDPGVLYYVKYPLEDGSGSVMIATTRPETMLGDVAVAVHPEDGRYASFIGKKLRLPLTDRVIPVIADDYVSLEFGTGAVKITPAHDPNDFEMGKRHGLEVINILTRDGCMNDAAGEKYAGLTALECRKAVVEDLNEQGLLEKTEDNPHSVGHCYRCHAVIEPMVSKQWFVRMKPLAEPAIEAVKNGSLRFVPERFTKIYLDWMENIRDWCISRQLWWGHRIPVWYCRECGEVICSKTEPSSCPSCGSLSLEQDPDVLDTWFSSGLWPFSTLGWPQEGEDLKKYYPNNVLVTGRDIIFFWVARMIVSGLESMKEIPFYDVFIHGLVLDSQGRKMSKSLNNGIDPLEVISEYGADSLRFMLITGNTPGNDIRFQYERLEASRNFANKLWNAARFVLMNLDDCSDSTEKADPAPEDRWIISRFNSTAMEVTRLLERYDLGEAGRLIYEFIWNEFCDWYIEMAKPRLYDKENAAGRRTAQTVLREVLQGSVEMLHPFMPFITEEIWQAVAPQGETIMLSEWPSGKESLVDRDVEVKMELIMEAVRSVRNLRSEMNIPPGKKAEIIIRLPEDMKGAITGEDGFYFRTLASAGDFSIREDYSDEGSSVTAVVRGMEIYMPLAGLVDLEKERKRLEKEMENNDREILRLEKKLDNRGFIAKAPEAVVQGEREKLVKYQANRKALEERLGALK